MAQLIFRRLLLGVLTLWLVSVIIFGGVELLPGDACTAFLERDAAGDLLENCRRDMGLNRPVLTRYAEWAAGALHLDFGVSVNGQESIAHMVGIRMRNSIFLAIGAMLVGIPLSIFLGVMAGLRRDRTLDLVLSTGAIFAMTLPEFVTATILIMIFSISLGWIPGIIIQPADASVWAFFPEIILPILALTLVMTAHIMRLVRSSMIEVMASDYVQMATLKGVPYPRIVWRHALPNALLPAINIIALTVAWLLGGVVVVEVVFNYPGMGRMLVNAISDQDLPVIQAIALLTSAFYIGINLIADLLSLTLNPRLRTQRMRST